MRKLAPRIRSEMRYKNIRHPDPRPASVVRRPGAEPEAVRALRPFEEQTCCTWTKNTTRHACWSAL
eukprot:6678164-Prymnesium_polylepis.1